MDASPSPSGESSPMPGGELVVLEPQVRPYRVGARMPQPGVELGLEPGDAHTRGRAHMKQGVQGPSGLVRHQHLDLSLGEILNMEVDRPCLKLLGLDYPPC